MKPALRPREGLRVPTSTAEHSMLLAECTLYFLALVVPVFELSATVRALLATGLALYLAVLLRDFWAWLAASDEARLNFIARAKKLDAERAKALRNLGGGWRWWHRLSLLVLLAVDAYAVWHTQNPWVAAPMLILLPLNALSLVDLARGRAV